MFLGLILGVAITLFIVVQLTPCTHKRTRMVHQCKDCNVTLGGLDETK